MMWKYFVLLLGIVAEIRVGDAYYYSTSSEDQIDNIENNVEILLNEQDRLDEKLDKVIKLLSADDEVEPTWPPLALLKASAELENIDTEEGGNTTQVKLTVWYRNVGHDDDVTVEWKISDQMQFKSLPETRSEGVSEGDGTIWSTSTVTGSDVRDRDLVLKITRQDLMLSYNIDFEEYYLQLDSEMSQRRSLLKVDTFEILNKGDVVYDADRQPAVKIRTHFNTRDPYTAKAIDIYVETIDVNSRELQAKTCRFDSESDWAFYCKISEGSKRKYRTYLEYEVELGKKSSSNDHSKSDSNDVVTGFTTLSVSTSDTPDFISDIEFGQTIVVRPESQPRPYPDDLLTVKFGSMADHNETTGDYQYTCSYDTAVCPISCWAHGNDLQELKLIKSLPDGETEEIKAEVQVLRDSAMLSAEATLTPVANFTIVDDFKCVVKTISGMSDEGTVHVTYVYPIAIDLDESYVQYNETHFTAVCVAHGYPLADMQIVAHITWEDERNHYRQTKRWTVPSVTVVHDSEKFMVNGTAFMVESPNPLEHGNFAIYCQPIKADGTKGKLGPYNYYGITQYAFPN